MTTHHPTTVTSEPDTPFTVVTREFDAPPALVYRAYTDRDLVTRWLGPRRYAMEVHEWDARTGGSYAYTHRGDDGQEYRFHGSFHSLEPGVSAVQTFEFAGAPGHVSLDAVTFEALPDGRTRAVTRSVFQSVEDRDAMMQAGMVDGMDEGFDRLDDLVAEQQAAV